MPASLREGASGVVNVPFVFGGLREAMTPIESIGWAVAQRAQMNRHITSIRPRKEMTKDVRANPTGLTARAHVKVVQVKAVACRTECVEADTLTGEYDELGVLGIERLAQPLARTLGVEAAHMLQTVSHRSDTQGHKLVEISHAHSRKRDGGDHVFAFASLTVADSGSEQTSMP